MSPRRAARAAVLDRVATGLLTIGPLMATVALYAAAAAATR